MGEFVQGFSWGSFFDLGGVAGFVSLLWQTVTHFTTWTGRPRLRIRPLEVERDLRIWQLMLIPGVPDRQRVFSLQVWNKGSRVARHVVGVLTFTRVPQSATHLDRRIGLHWGDLAYDPATTGAQAVDIAGTEEHRLDVAFARASQQVPGSWAAMPLALASPTPNQAHLPPGQYEIEVTVTSDNAARTRARFVLTSPDIWSNLAVARRP
jgi:hypothetical protein